MSTPAVRMVAPPDAQVESSSASTAFTGLGDDNPLTTGPTRDEQIGGERSFTPGRSRSNNYSRPHSRGTGRTSNPRGVSPESDAAAQRQVLSRRKERRWDNDRRIGADAVVASNRAGITKCISGRDAVGCERRHILNLAAYDPDLGEFDVHEASKLIYQREGSSVFDEFDDELRAVFLGGGAVKLMAQASGRRANKPVHFDENSARHRFSRLDNNLKHHLSQTGSREPFLTFIALLEVFLLETLDCEESQPGELAAPPALQKLLLRKPATVIRKKSESPAIELLFKTSVHRLLTHAVCQWHGLVSASHMEENNNYDGARKHKVVRVHNPKYDVRLSGWSFAEANSEVDPITTTNASRLFNGEHVVPIVPFLLGDERVK